MNKIFLFDIDGTLSKDGIIPKSALETLKMIRKNGDSVLLATGRCLGQMSDVLSKVSIDGAILNNGAYAVLNGKVFSNHPIDIDCIYRLLHMGHHMCFLTKDRYVRLEDHKIFDEFFGYFKISPPGFADLSVLDEDIYSLGVYTYDIDSFDMSLYPEVDFVQVAPLGFDVISHGYNKGTSVQELKEIYPDKEIIAFGDNYNDMEMLKAADIAIVMPQAPDEVKSLATYITRDVFDDGIEYAVKELLKYEN